MLLVFLEVMVLLWSLEIHHLVQQTTGHKFGNIFKQVFFIFLNIGIFSVKGRPANTNLRRFSLLYFSCGLESIFVLALRNIYWLYYEYQDN